MLCLEDFRKAFIACGFPVKPIGDFHGLMDYLPIKGYKEYLCCQHYKGTSRIHIKGPIFTLSFDIDDAELKETENGVEIYSGGKRIGRIFKNKSK